MNKNTRAYYRLFFVLRIAAVCSLWIIEKRHESSDQVSNLLRILDRNENLRFKKKKMEMWKHLLYYRIVPKVVHCHVWNTLIFWYIKTKAKLRHFRMFVSSLNFGYVWAEMKIRNFSISNMRTLYYLLKQNKEKKPFWDGKSWSAENEY